MFERGLRPMPGDESTLQTAIIFRVLPCKKSFVRPKPMREGVETAEAFASSVRGPVLRAAFRRFAAIWRSLVINSHWLWLERLTRS